MAKTRVTAALAGMAGLGAAALYRRRGKVADVVPRRLADFVGTSAGEAAAPAPPAPVPEPAPPQPANYDASGPVANTATPIPAPDRHPREAIDEEAEIAAAAAEARAIGGGIPEYPGLESSSRADEAFRPLEEAGEGEGEGQELAEYELVESAQPSDGLSDAQRQIEETIEAQDDPFSGEYPEPLTPSSDPLSEAESAAREREAGRGFDPAGSPDSPSADDPDAPLWSRRTGES
jgi:hypothetical protein